MIFYILKSIFNFLEYIFYYFWKLKKIKPVKFRKMVDSVPVFMRDIWIA